VVLVFETNNAAYRAYDPARVEEYNRDLPRLRALVEGRSDDESSQLRWLLAAVGGVRDAARSEVLALIQPSSQRWTIVRRGRDNSFVGQAMFALLLVGASDEGARVASSISHDVSYTQRPVQVVVPQAMREESVTVATAGVAIELAKVTVLPPSVLFARLMPTSCTSCMLALL